MLVMIRIFQGAEFVRADTALAVDRTGRATIYTCTSKARIVSSVGIHLERAAGVSAR